LTKLKIAIDFRVDDPRQGVGTAVLALAHGLSQLENVGQEYIFIVPEHIVEWLKPHLGGACTVVGVPPAKISAIGRLKLILAKVPPLRRLWLMLRRGESLVPSSDGLAERLGCHVVHFPAQIAYTTRIPSIYQPWDLQHKHLPDFFSKEDLRLRNVQYPAFCRQARFVCIQTEWGKQDLIEQFGVDPEKIKIIRWGSAFEAYEPISAEQAEEIRRELSLPDRFFVYPAVTWPHKNHAAILQALALLKQNEGLTVHMVFTGATTPFRAELDKLALSLGVAKQLHFKGFVNSRQIQAIFQLATAMLFPSRFEGLGLPILEAFRVGLPVICSSATVLPEVSGGGALLFDPDSPQKLVDNMLKLLDSPDTRSNLIAQGFRSLERYSASSAAREFVELYRSTAEANAEETV
jgi:glycosyltransferase involved in cell wall biosynthesis